jgi:hypothetical protein
MAKKKLPGPSLTKREGMRRLAEKKYGPLRPVTRKSKGEGTALMIMVPTETLKSLRTQAAENGSTVRALVLMALSTAGYPVPADELVDRRRMSVVLE